MVNGNNDFDHILKIISDYWQIIFIYLFKIIADLKIEIVRLRKDIDFLQKTKIDKGER